MNRMASKNKGPEPDLPYPPQSPMGLAARWVRWAASSDLASNPLTDRTGRFAGTNQPDDVWFLAGCFGGEVSRVCSVPAGRALFLPAINVWEFSPLWSKWIFGNPEVPDLSGAEGYLRVNEQAVGLEAIHTPQPFFVSGAADNPATGTSKRRRAMVAGLWKRLDALHLGSHRIAFGGRLPGFQVDACYEINVV